MDTGLLRNNYVYYNGFEGEDEVVLSLASNKEISIHLWIGYLDDILREPTLDGSNWSGFTRDYHQLEGAFSQDGNAVTVNPFEYYKDLQLYADRKYDEPETTEVFQLIATFLEYAIQEKSLVIIVVN